MGYREMGAVMECRAIKHRAHFCALLAIAYHVKGDEGLCTASKETLVAESRLGRTLLYDALAALQSDGPAGYGEPIVEVVEAGGGAGHTTAYRLNLAWLRAHGPRSKTVRWADASEAEAGTKTVRSPDGSARDTVRPPDDNRPPTGHEPVKEPRVEVGAQAEAREPARAHEGPVRLDELPPNVLQYRRQIKARLAADDPARRQAAYQALRAGQLPDRDVVRLLDAAEARAGPLAVAAALTVTANEAEAGFPRKRIKHFQSTLDTILDHVQRTRIGTDAGDADSPPRRPGRADSPPPHPRRGTGEEELDALIR